MNIQQLKIDKRPTVFVAEMEKPSWDTFFMGLSYFYCTRSPDQQTKTGCVIVDWASKRPIGLGYNGHPRGMEGLPTMREGSVLVSSVNIPGDEHFGLGRTFYKGEVVPKDLRSQIAEDKLQGAPDKYTCTAHADSNAIVNCSEGSENAVGYLPFEPCENCFILWLSKMSPRVIFKRIVILTSRSYPNTMRLINGCPDIKVETMSSELAQNRNSGFASAKNDPALALLQAAQYCNLMVEQSDELSKNSTLNYSHS